MTPTEAVMLLRKVRAYRPAMTIDDYSGDAWSEALDDIRLVDASEAVRNIARRTSDWIDPAMIRTEVARIRAQRIASHEADLIPPPWTDQADYFAWLRDTRHRLADGESPAAINADNGRGELRQRDMRVLSGGGAA